ncbi:K Homology domain, type 1-containing protein [Strongyloides ratti]|uniref:K Homology domain, type 1-containing protein n=1 Tax=Strongyloides ratti TaxID=34506 RepID=A0A090L8T1_STRRB|nr:K Homology domain, type 1-containing protein [Strongyloides ratti]CEF64548.1 K Homology domain, type 1-containing protein [Strongyloides ratti]
MCYTPYNDLETLRIIDTQLQKIEKITMNMAKDFGLSTTSTTTKEVEKESTKILTDTTKLQSKYFNNLLSEPVFISDDKTFLVNRNVKCHKTGKMQVEIVKKINIKNYSNVNVIGKLIGLRGNTIKNLEKSTQSKIIIRGKGSMRNDGLEKYLIQQGICYHLIEPLHILVTTRTSSEDGCLEKLELVKKKIISILCQKKNTHQR